MKRFQQLHIRIHATLQNEGNTQRKSTTHVKAPGQRRHNGVRLGAPSHGLEPAPALQHAVQSLSLLHAQVGQLCNLCQAWQRP